MNDTRPPARSNAAGSTIAEQLSRFACELRVADVPAPVSNKVKLQLLDTIGVALASSTFDFARRAVDGLLTLGEGPSTVIGFHERLSVSDAALANGILVHGLDYDDTSIYGRVHPSSACGTAALALGAHLRQSGTECMLSYLIGLECEIRLGAVAKGGLQRRGFHPTGVIGAFGATMVAGRLLALPPDKLAMAQGIALSMAAGSQEFAGEGAWTKRMHPGWAAAVGITAAALAKGGFIGPSKPYEGRFGLFTTYLNEPATASDLEVAVAGLSAAWQIETIATKPLPACYFNVPVIDAAVRIAETNDLRASDITRIEVLLPQAAVQLVCEPGEAKRRPTDCYAAQFSVFFCVAVALARRRFALQDLEDEALHNAEILSLIERTEYAIDEKTTFPKFYSAAVRMTTHDGRTFEAREDVHRGAPEYPLSESEIVAKFMENAERVFSHARATRIRETVEAVEQIDDLNELTHLLGREPPQSGKPTRTRASAPVDQAR